MLSSHMVAMRDIIVRQSYEKGNRRTLYSIVFSATL